MDAHPGRVALREGEDELVSSPFLLGIDFVEVAQIRSLVLEDARKRREQPSGAAEKPSLWLRAKFWMLASSTAMLVTLSVGIIWKLPVILVINALLFLGSVIYFLIRSFLNMYHEFINRSVKTIQLANNASESYDQLARSLSFYKRSSLIYVANSYSSHEQKVYRRISLFVGSEKTGLLTFVGAMAAIYLAVSRLIGDAQFQIDARLRGYFWDGILFFSALCLAVLLVRFMFGSLPNYAELLLNIANTKKVIEEENKR